MPAPMTTTSSMSVSRRRVVSPDANLTISYRKLFSYRVSVRPIRGSGPTLRRVIGARVSEQPCAKQFERLAVAELRGIHEVIAAVRHSRGFERDDDAKPFEL